MSQDKPNQTQSAEDDNRLVAERRAKLDAMREAGTAFPNDFRPDARAATLHREYGDADKWTTEALQSLEREFRVAGRLVGKRVMGKASFVHLLDGSGERIQLYIQRDALPEGVYQAFKGWDVGDVVAATGTLMRTRTGELTIQASQFRLMVKSLRPLPEKWHGLSDQETRYRQRYVDLIVNPEVRQAFETRSRVIRIIRNFLEARQFLEVETPMMHHIPGGATARPFVTHHNALGIDLYLRVAPELHLKRLVVGGMERVFEINRNFRNEGVSTRHNPEFTMLEFYQAWADYSDLMELTEQLLRQLATELSPCGDALVAYQGASVDFGKPFERISVAAAVCRFNPDIPEADTRDPDKLRAHCHRLGIQVEDSAGWGRLLMEIFEHTVEDGLVQPTFVTGYPTEVSPLSRRNDRDPEVVDRFELFICGREIANGFSELNDPEDQAERFREQVAAREGGDQEAMAYDSDYIRALEYGLPPTAGEGIGIDRLVMLLTDAASIRDVLLFPYLKPESE